MKTTTPKTKAKAPAAKAAPAKKAKAASAKMDTKAPRKPAARGRG